MLAGTCVRKAIVPFLVLAGCAGSSDYSTAGGKLAGYALSCAVGGCAPSPHTFVILQGRVLTSGGAGDRPLARARVVLELDGRPVAAATTDNAGHFQFNQDLDAGLYYLGLDSDRYQGTVAVLLEGQARTVDLRVLATPP